MAEVGLLEAWRIWWAGKPTDTLVLWGLHMLWWGWIGTLLQGASFLTIVLEVIGAHRINQFGDWLGHRIRIERPPALGMDDADAGLLSPLSTPEQSLWVVRE